PRSLVPGLAALAALGCAAGDPAVMGDPSDPNGGGGANDAGNPGNPGNPNDAGNPGNITDGGAPADGGNPGTPGMPSTMTPSLPGVAVDGKCVPLCADASTDAD